MLPVYSGGAPGAADQCTPLLAGYHRAIVDVIVIAIFWHGHHRAIVDIIVIFIFISSVDRAGLERTEAGESAPSRHEDITSAGADKVRTL